MAATSRCPARRRFFRAAAGACRRHRHRPSGARVLRQPVGGGEPVPRCAAGAAHVRLARRDGGPGARDARGHRRRHRRPTDRRRADHRAAAGGADRRGDRPRRPRHRLRRADEQPVAARGGAALRADRRLREQGVTAIYVSHRMDEIFRLCDAVTVLRDGRHVATQPIASLDRAALVELMIGRRLEEYFPAHVQAAPGPELLRVEGLESRRLSRRLVLRSRRRSPRARRARRRRALRSRAGDVRPRPARDGAYLRAGPAGRDLESRAGDEPSASASCPRIASARAWCCR